MCEPGERERQLRQVAGNAAGVQLEPLSLPLAPVIHSMVQAGPNSVIVVICIIQTSVVDPNTLNLDPDPGF